MDLDRSVLKFRTEMEQLKTHKKINKNQIKKVNTKTLFLKEQKMVTTAVN